MVDAEGAQKLLERQAVEVAPLAFMRGRTLNNSFIILDEAQNATPEQMKMFLTRIGFGSKVVVTGDTTQIDVPDGRSGLLGLERTLSGIDGLAFVHLGAGDVVRHRIVADIVAAYERTSAASRRRQRTWLTRADPDSPPAHKVGGDGEPEVFCADEQNDVPVDLERWQRLATEVLRDEGVRGLAELSCCSSARPRSTELNEDYMGKTGPHRRARLPASTPPTSPRWCMHRQPPPVAPTGRRPTRATCRCCSAMWSSARPWPRGRRPSTPAPSTTSWRCWSCTASCTCSATTTPSPTKPSAMRARELALLEAHHWGGPAPAGVPAGAPE